MPEKLLEPYSRQKEEEITRFWLKRKVPALVRKQSGKQKKAFYFMDGPPYATGHIHMGTALNKIQKDVAIRSRRMQGCNVFDRPGYDCHGLPIENKVEEKLGFKSKQDIEQYGVGKFIKECKQYATQFIDVMNNEFNDLGVWMGWQNPYLTLSNEYIEAIWWTFKKAEEKGLLYKGLYPVHVCPRCETAVAFNEIEYSKLTDEAVFVKFKVKGEENTFLVVWTTTPWTLPGNTGVMVHPAFDYSFAKMSNGETWVIAKEKVQELMAAIEAGFTIEKTVKGKELQGMQYENPLAKHLQLPPLKNAYRVILSERYVNLEEGTGLVHSAPGHGKEDFDAGSKAGLPAISPVQLNGLMTAEAGKYSGKRCREVDKEIIADLEQANALVYRHPYTHDYPLCWRCKNPLLMLSVPQWFFKISSIQKRMIELNGKVQWVPDWMQSRMQNWLESIGDWPISRARYWGTPIPIWQCGKCKEQKVIGSLKELQKLSGKKVKELHKPEIDSVEIKCSCGAKMRRVSEVLDVWFDSGVSSWAALGFPASSALFKRFWPADLNLEGTDQFRGWWNSELILSTIAFDKAPFKTISVHGLVLDIEKRKMSKSKGNAVQPKEVIEKHSRDYLRYYLTATSKGEDFAFDWDSFKDIHRFFSIFWNCFNYANMYLKLDIAKGKKISTLSLQVEDKWILSKLNSLIETATDAYNSYNFFRATAAIEQFVLEDLSRTYIKLIRGRTEGKTAQAVNKTMSAVIDGLLLLLSPITPHITEYIYQHLRNGKMPLSIHLRQLPAVEKKLVDPELEKQFDSAKELTQAVLSLREQQKLRLRWPLRELVIVTEKKPFLPKQKSLGKKSASGKGKQFSKVHSVIASSCNVKRVVEATAEPSGNYARADAAGAKLFLLLDADGQLRNEWELQELRRRIQEMRKQANLLPQQKALLLVACDDKSFLQGNRKWIEKETNTAMQIVEKEVKEKLIERSFSIELKK